MELVIGESVKETNRVFIKSYTEEYCKAITENYREYHIRTLKGNLHGNYPEYARQQLDEIENGTANLMKFEIREGKKYYKIVQMEYDRVWKNGIIDDSNIVYEYREGSVHAFVDKNTGNVYKPASWKAPAKHIRFTFQKPEDIRFLLTPMNVDWAGGYLYMR